MAVATDKRYQYYDKIESYIDDNPVDLYIDYRDELSEDMIDAILAGDRDGYRDLLSEMEIDAIDYIDAGEYFRELAEDLKLSDDQVERWRESIYGYWPAVTLSDSGERQLLSNSSTYIAGETEIEFLDLDGSVEYRDIKQFLDMLEINPADYKRVAVKYGYKVAGAWPDIRRRDNPAIDLDNFFSNISCYYPGVVSFLLYDLEEIKIALESATETVTLTAGTELVIYNYFNGAGITEAPLIRDLTIKKTDITFTRDDRHRYGIQDCYGFTTSTWSKGGVR